MRIDITCAQCGSNRFSLIDGQSDESLISCEECGHKIGTLAMLKEMFAAEVLKHKMRVNPPQH